MSLEFSPPLKAFIRAPSAAFLLLAHEQYWNFNHLFAVQYCRHSNPFTGNFTVISDINDLFKKNFLYKFIVKQVFE